MKYRFLFTLLLLSCALQFSPPAGTTAPLELNLPFELNGFLEEASALRTQNDPQQENDFILGELRLQLEAFKALDWGEFKFRGDFIHDQAMAQFDFDLREAHMLVSPTDFFDLKVGRQILTWGTGDLIFLNDLFPKDFEAFFIGRNDVYLKAPANAVKFSFFPEFANIDLVWTPVFNSDRFITGRRLSFFNGILGRKTGNGNRINANKPNRGVKDSELALRISKNVKGYELALYGYYGFFRGPGGSDASGRGTFPRLAVYGASVRGDFMKGIGNLEIAYRDSLDDRAGTVPNVNNSEFRFLAGFTRELFTNFTLGLQYNLERTLQFDKFIRNLPPGAFPKDENRHVTTVRLTWLVFQQNVELSMFTFYSPSDGDAHLRPSVLYKITDDWAATVGANIFAGPSEKTFFGQLKDNANVYARLRRSF